MKYKSAWALSLLMFLTIIFAGANPLPAQDLQGKKAVILIMDYCDVADLDRADTPNLDSLIDKSGTALINIRTKSKLPGSSYMSLAAGTRVGLIPNAEYSFNSSEVVKEIPNVFADEDSQIKAAAFYKLFTGQSAPAHGIVNLYSEPLQKYASKHYPVFEIGQLGKAARESGLKIAVLGNSDTNTYIDRNVALLAMDENGKILQGNVSREVLESAPQSLGGVRSNHQVLLDNMHSLLPSSDILVIDMGDTSRIEKSSENCSDKLLLKHRLTAIERNDRLLGKIMANIDLNQTLLIMISPNPNKDMVLQGNFALAPIIMYNPAEGKGLLTSSTTRRTGLVNSSDFLPSVINYFDNTKFPGSGMKIIKTDHNQLALLAQQAQFYLNQRRSRNPVHYLFMLLALLLILSSIMLYMGKYDRFKKYFHIIIYAALSVPIIILFLHFTGYNSLPNVLLITMGTALLSGTLLYAVFRQADKALIILCGITTLLLTIDCFRGSPFMLFSLLGSDTIAGGRFYGLGNDYMGVYLAAALVFICLFLARLKLRSAGKTAIGVILLLIVSTAIGSPSFGADVGGLVTTLITLGIFILFNLEKKLHLKQLLSIAGISILLVILVAIMDSLFSSNPSHAGKTINLLLSGQSAAFFAIIRTKLGIVGSTIYHSAWSIIILICIMAMLFFWIKDRSRILRMATEQPELNKLSKLLITTIITVFVFNDTGIIAAALATLYLIGCLGLLRNPNQEYIIGSEETDSRI